MKKPSRNTTAAVIVPLAAAVAARLFLLVEWFGSPFRYYHGVSGLDMMTHLYYGRQLYENNMQFSIHRAMVALTMLFNRGTPVPDAVIIMQMLLGIPVGAMMGYAALHLTGKRWWAMLTGLTAALYSPFLIHECFLTKDALVPDFAALSLFLLVWGRKHHFRGWWRLPLVCLGLCLPFLVHISTVFFAAAGYLWLWYYLKWNIRRMIPAMLPVVAILLLLSAHVYMLSGYFLPMHVSRGYRQHAIEVSRAQSDSNVMTMDFSGSQKTPVAFNYLKKAFLLIKPHEIPNNINHYFVKNRLAVFRFLPGPLLFIPFAGTALIFLCFSRKWLRRFNLPLLYVCCYAVPLIAFMPLARYRMILCPALAVMAPYVIYLSWKWYREKRKIFPLPLAAAAVYSIVLFPGFEDNLLRASDFVAYGHAQKFRDGNTRAAEQSYLDALGHNPDHLPAVVNIAEILLLRNDIQTAVNLLHRYHFKYPQAESINYYYGVALVHAEQFQAAIDIFEGMTPPANDNIRTSFYYYWGEGLRRLGKNDEAMTKFREALSTATSERAQAVERAMTLIKSE